MRRAPAEFTPGLRPCQVPEILRRRLSGKGPKVAPIAPIGRVIDFRCRCARTMIPLAPSWGVTFRKSQGATRGAGRDAECVVARPDDPSFEKSHPGGLYAAFSMEKPDGRGTYGGPDYEPSGICFRPIRSRERIHL